MDHVGQQRVATGISISNPSTWMVGDEVIVDLNHTKRFFAGFDLLITVTAAAAWSAILTTEGAATSNSLCP